MWYENIEFKVDREFKSAMEKDDVLAIKKILVPSKNPEDVSLNSLLPEVIKLGKIYFDEKEALLKFYKLDEREQEEGKVIFNNYLIDSINILIELIDYLVSKGADVNGVVDPRDHNVWCSDGRLLYTGSFASESDSHKVNHYDLSTSIYMPLAIGKFNAIIIGRMGLNSKYRIKGDDEYNGIRSAQSNLHKYIVEQNYNMQIKLTKN